MKVCECSDVMHIISLPPSLPPSRPLSLLPPPLGKEVIVGGNFLPSTMCLAHCKVQKSHVDFWVRTSSSLLTESVVKFVQMIFKWFFSSKSLCELLDWFLGIFCIGYLILRIICEILNTLRAPPRPRTAINIGSFYVQMASPSGRGKANSMP